MKVSTNDEFMKIIIDRMWMNFGNKQYKGLTPYEVARKMGLNDEGAKKNSKLCDGPKIFK